MERPPFPPRSRSKDHWLQWYNATVKYYEEFEQQVKELQARRPVMLDIPRDKSLPSRNIYAEGEDYAGFDESVVYWYEELQNLVEGLVPSTRLEDAQREWESKNWV